jgi:hypothetical protein
LLSAAVLVNILGTVDVFQVGVEIWGGGENGGDAAAMPFSSLARK